MLINIFISTPHVSRHKNHMEFVLFIMFIIKLNIMDNFQHCVSSSERFTTEEVRKVLGFNDDYSNSSSSSSSDCEQDISEVSSDVSAIQSKSELEQIIPPSPKRIKKKPILNLHLI